MAFKVFSTSFVSKILFLFYSVYPCSYHVRDSAAMCSVFGTSGDGPRNKFIS